MTIKQNIIAIGGGDFKANKTLSIDREIVRTANTQHPRLLFVPTASHDDLAYAKAITKHFSDLGCTVETLLLWKERPDHLELAARFDTADIIYVGGGNTLKMMNRWRKLGVDKLLTHARERGVVLSGVSAGSICWFSYGSSDSRKDKDPDADYVKVAGLGFINALHCPHYDSELARRASLQQMMRKFKDIVAIALDDCAALQVVDDTYRILSNHERAHGYKIYWHNGQLHHEVIAKETAFKPLARLLLKEEDEK